MAESHDTAIELVKISKSYSLYKSPSDAFRESLFGAYDIAKKVVLENISFTVNKGEIVGVLGRNGAGKTTLLRIIAGAIKPTSGSVKTYGRLSPMLELGSGFNEEYTGRDNIEIGGLCMGMSRHAIKEKMEEIISFSELGEVIDQTIKTYSTGMRMRLAFSTAIHSVGDILIIDEALAVGDALFQSKCMDKLKDLQLSGKTIFFVSHSVGSVYELCSRAILLDGGAIISDGLPRDVGNKYEALLQQRKGELLTGSGQPVTTIVTNETSHAESSSLLPNGNDESAGSSTEVWVTCTGNDFEFQTCDLSPVLGLPSFCENENLEARVVSLGIFDINGVRCESLENGEKYQIRIKVETKNPSIEPVVGFVVELLSGTVLFGTSTFNAGKKFALSDRCEYEGRFNFEAVLGQGVYTLGGAVASMLDGEPILCHSARRVISFEVASPSSFEGRVNLTNKVEAVTLANSNQTQPAQSLDKKLS